MTDPLVALFRQEVTAHAATMADALAVLAVDAGHATDWPALGLAAQAARGAALLVGQSEAAEVAAALDGAFAARAAGRAAEMLAAVDVLRAIADADEGAAPAADRIAAVLTNLQVGSPHAPQRPPVAPGGPSPPPFEQPAPESTPLLELFREEVRSLCDGLSAGLVELEANADPKRIEPLMRAAHSVKGAARIVGCEPAVGLAHAMEERLVAAQKGRGDLTPTDVDALLAATDLLALLATADLAAWAVEHANRAAELAAALTAPDGRDKPGRSPTPPPVAPSPPPPVTPSSDAERVVRVSATSLSRLLSLAGESLVEARWLQPFARSLLKLKKYQDHLAGVLEELGQAVKAGGRPTDLADDALDRLTACRHVLADRIEEFESHARRSDDLNSRLYREVIASRMRPFADGAHGFARMVRDVARGLGKKVKFEVAGEGTDVDRDILDKLEAPLGHILRNAVDHGLESPADRAAAGKPEAGTIRVEARHHAGLLNVSVADDGRGIDVERLRRKVVERGLAAPDMAGRMTDAELIEFLFLPGFTTADAVTDVSGRGVGLDVVQSTAQAVGGAVRVTTRPGRGTTFEFQLPITLSVVRAVLVRVSGDPYALPLNRTDRLLRLPPDRVRSLEGKPHFEADGRHVGLVPAHLVFDLPPGDPPADELSVVLVSDRGQPYGLLVEGFLGEQDLVVRPLDPRLGKVPNVAAAAILEDGSPVLIVDVDDVTRSVAQLVTEGKLRHQRPTPAKGKRRRKRVLVVDDSAIVREVERQLLQGRGYDVDVAVDGADGWNAARAGGYELVVTDIDMPRMTGLELVRAIRADARVQGTPVVVVSYKDRDEDRGRGLDAGANYYLTKGSFHDGRFLQAVEDLIGAAE